MFDLKSHAKGLALAVASTLLMATTVQAEDANRSICSLVLDEEWRDLEEAELVVDLNQSSFETFEEYFQLVAELKKDDLIDRMTYLKIRYERDSAKVALERANLILMRQEALIEHLSLACGKDSTLASAERFRGMDRAYESYRHAECDQQAKAIEVAEINLEYNKVWLASILDLRSQISTRLDVLRAELDVTHEEQRRDDAIQRTEACRAALGETKEAPTSGD
jgi:hypothetical protein